MLPHENRRKYFIRDIVCKIVWLSRRYTAAFSDKQFTVVCLYVRDACMHVNGTGCVVVPVCTLQCEHVQIHVVKHQLYINCTNYSYIQMTLKVNCSFRKALYVCSRVHGVCMCMYLLVAPHVALIVLSFFVRLAACLTTHFTLVLPLLSLSSSSSFPSTDQLWLLQKSMLSLLATTTSNIYKCQV